MTYNKYATFILTFIITLISFTSCKKKETPKAIDNTIEGFEIATSFKNNDHTINIYTENGKFQVGYNLINIQIIDNNNQSISNAIIQWKPTMYMNTMHHSAPYSNITTKNNTDNIYAGYIVFQMASDDAAYWELSIDYQINGNQYNLTEKINVQNALKRNIETFVGSDSQNYIIALVDPKQPKVAINDMTALIFTTNNHSDYTPVENYKIIIDPRMPGMGNHSSPNNENLTFGNNNLYNGKLSLTMTGYWKINLQLENNSGQVLKGEPISASNESSSIFFEIEF